MAQIIKLRRGSLERLSTITGSLQKGEIVIASGSSNITSSNGSSIVFAAVESGSVRAVNRVLRGTNAPNIFSGSTYNGLVDGVPYYASGSQTLYLLGSDRNEAIDLTGNIGTFSGSVAASVTSLSASIAANTGIFTPTSSAATVTGSVYRTQNTLEITGSVRVSGTIDPDNVTVGIPSSNAWQSGLSGSYFNNFTSETNVSEILRFVAGLLSASAPDASPNTRTFSSATANAVNTTTGTALTGRIPQSTSNGTVTYLQSKGFATAGSTIFSGITPIYTDSTYALNYTSVAAGTTVVTSSADAQLFGLGVLSNGSPTNFKLSGSFTHRFKDNSTKTDTVISSSNNLVTQTGAGTTNGVTLAKINTANSAVIPAAYQDGKFANSLTQSIYVTGSTSTVNIAGYYDVTASISIASGSSGYSSPVTVNSGIFYAPLTTIATNVPAQTVTTSSVALAYVTAVSRSLSGAPYLSGSTYTVSCSVSGVFAPLFLNGTNAQLTLSGTGMGTVIGNNALATSNGTISNANVVFDSTGTTVRNTATIPFETDIVKLNGTYALNGANITNIAQTSFTPTTFTVSAVGYDYAGAADTYTNTFSYHVAGTFGQPAGSGSLAYFTRTQGADTSTALIESFTGENYRIQLADNVLAFNGTAWTTTFALNQLGANDLQVKPGYLVKPGGTYGYWLGDPDTSKTYKYYVRKFTTSGTKTSMTLNLGQALVNWGTTTNNSIGALILFESSGTNVYGAGNARLYDPSDLLSNFVTTRNANTDGTNPFGANFQQYGNTGGSLATTTYTIPLRSADGMNLNATYTNIYVIVRYKGDPTPVTSITTTFS